MSAKHLLGIDIGTTSTKLLIIDDRGGMSADVSLPATLSSPRPGWAEEDPKQWWWNVCALVPEVLAKAGISASQVEAVGVSGMVPALVALDGDGRCLRPSIQQNDARAIAEIEALRSKTREGELLRRTGSLVTQQSLGPKLLWLAEHEPELVSKIARVMGSYDYIAYRLTGKFSAERNWALESGLMSMDSGDWDGEYSSLARVDPSWLGEIHLPADIVGRVSATAAAECSLLAGTPVVAGSADHVASAFSAGLLDEGDLLVKLGGAGDILFCVDSPRTDPRLYLDYHVAPGKYLVNGCMASSGSLIRWFRDQLSPGTDYAELDREAWGLPAGSEGVLVLPYFLGEKTPLHDPYARGTIVGLSLAHTKAHLFRATLEGISYGFRHHLLVMSELGLKPRRVRLTNGGAHSLLWRQVTADVLGLPLEVVAGHPGSSLGAAFIAGFGAGLFPSWEDIGRYVSIGSVIEPDPKAQGVYERRFASYLDAYESLKHLYPSLADPGSGAA
jgi:xylulokinase